MARIQSEDFDPAAELRHLVAQDRRTGGSVIFLGTARDFSQGRQVLRLEFEHFAGMAEQELERIEKQATKRFDILKCLIVHRVGTIGIGENIVLVMVSAEHRGAAFDACEWAIDELKQRVPIWKKEFGTDGASWVEKHP